MPANDKWDLTWRLKG